MGNSFPGERTGCYGKTQTQEETLLWAVQRYTLTVEALKLDGLQNKWDLDRGRRKACLP